MPAKTPEQRRAYEAARRRSKRVKFRLTEDEAQQRRNAAAGARMSLNAYMLAALEGQPRSIVDFSRMSRSSRLCLLPYSPTFQHSKT
jgi:Mobilization protein NikA